MTCYYFYLWDEEFGWLHQGLRFFPYQAKVWVNGHESAKRQAVREDIGFAGLANGFAACDNPEGLQAICDRFQAGNIQISSQRWLYGGSRSRWRADRAAGLLAGVVDAAGRGLPDHRLDDPRRARLFFEALVTNDLASEGRSTSRSFRPPGPLRHPRASRTATSARSSTRTTRA